MANTVQKLRQLLPRTLLNIVNIEYMERLIYFQPQSSSYLNLWINQRSPQSTQAAKLYNWSANAGCTWNRPLDTKLYGNNVLVTKYYEASQERTKCDKTAQTQNSNYQLTSFVLEYNSRTDDHFLRADQQWLNTQVNVGKGSINWKKSNRVSPYK